MTDAAPKLSGIAWGHFNRWFLRGRVFRIAIQMRMLLLSTVGVLLTIFGWWLIAKAFAGTDDAALKSLLADYRSCPWTSSADERGMLEPLAGVGRMGDPPRNAVVDPWGRLSRPVIEWLDLSQSFVGAAFLSLCFLWAVAVWSLFGGAITRGALLQLTRDEPASLGTTLRYARRRWISYFAAPVMPLVGLMLIAVPTAILGLLMKASVLIAGIAWPAALVGGVVGAILMTGLVVGWPLMHPTISAEGIDSFDALSRPYSYVYQRPLHYLLYGAAASLLGLLGLTLVEFFAGAVWRLTAWGASWGSGRELMLRALAQSPELTGHDRWGVKLIDFWHGGLRLVVVGFAFSFFWSAASAVYLLLRHDADGAELDQIHLDDEETVLSRPEAKTTPAAEPPVADITTQPE